MNDAFIGMTLPSVSVRVVSWSTLSSMATGTSSSCKVFLRGMQNLMGAVVTIR